MNRVRLGDIAKIGSGGTPPRSNPEYWGGTIPWVKTTQIQNCTINNDDIEERITESGLRHSSAKMVPAGNIVMAMIGQGRTRGQVARLGLDACTNQNAATIEAKSDYDNDFIYQQLLFRYRQIRNASNSSGQQNLNLDIIRSLRFPAPPLPEQKAIADLLSTWDRAIENTDRLIAAKEQKLGWQQQILLTGESRIRGQRHGWRTVRLSDVLTEHGTRSTGKEEVFSVSVHKGLVNQVEHLGRVFAAKDTSRYNRVSPGDVVYTKSPTGDFPYGIVKQSRVDTPVIVSPLYGVFTPASYAMGTFLNAYFESPVRTSNFLRPLIQKGAKNTINITNRAFLSGKLTLPTSKPETATIAATLDTARREIDLLKKQAEAYRQQKRGLMQRLLTGEWRTRTDTDLHRDYFGAGIAYYGRTDHWETWRIRQHEDVSDIGSHLRCDGAVLRQIH